MKKLKDWKTSAYGPHNDSFHYKVKYVPVIQYQLFRKPFPDGFQKLIYNPSAFSCIVFNTEKSAAYSGVEPERLGMLQTG